MFAHSAVEGLEHLRDLDGPVVFASNHQSHMDVPVILAALPGRWRARVAPAMAKEFFKAHFFPAGFTWRERFTNALNYYLAAFYFNAFPLPQREAGARQTLQYIGELTGDGWSILIFPEGLRSPTGDIKPFRGGIGMIALAPRRARSCLFASTASTSSSLSAVRSCGPDESGSRSARRSGCMEPTTPHSPLSSSRRFATCSDSSIASFPAQSSTFNS